MQFKLILALADEAHVDPILRAAREAGATGATVISSARGEGLRPRRRLFGLDVLGQREVVLLVVEEHLARAILEAVAAAGEFDERPETGIAIQLAIEDAVGLAGQIRALSKKVGDQL